MDHSQDDGAMTVDEGAHISHFQQQVKSVERAGIIDPAEAQKAGWKHVDPGGNGDCFFRATAKAQAWMIKGQELTPEQTIAKGSWLRSLTVKHIKKHIDRFREAWAIPTSGKFANMSFDDWLAEAANKRLLQTACSFKLSLKFLDVLLLFGMTKRNETQSLGQNHSCWAIWT